MIIKEEPLNKYVLPVRYILNILSMNYTHGNLLHKNDWQ